MALVQQQDKYYIFVLQNQILPLRLIPTISYFERAYQVMNSRTRRVSQSGQHHQSAALALGKIKITWRNYKFKCSYQTNSLKKLSKYLTN
jgi:hypothetical protein